MFLVLMILAAICFGVGALVGAGSNSHLPVNIVDIGLLFMALAFAVGGYWGYGWRRP